VIENHSKKETLDDLLRHDAFIRR